MSVEAKIRLSPYEMELVTNHDWILTKQAILNKVHLLFGAIHQSYKCISNNSEQILPGVDFTKNGKISKGENYIGLPYVILDYPALFKKENVFAIRTMFWWGNFFSITLHISGKNMMQNISIYNLIANIKETDFFVCVNENEWQH
ncbi:MAG: hypothetical protein ABIO81_00410, partial [Ginsengibacter sp.]